MGQESWSSLAGWLRVRIFYEAFMSLLRLHFEGLTLGWRVCCQIHVCGHWPNASVPCHAGLSIVTYMIWQLAFPRKSDEKENESLHCLLWLSLRVLSHHLLSLLCFRSMWLSPAHMQQEITWLHKGFHGKCIVCVCVHKYKSMTTRCLLLFTDMCAVHVFSTSCESLLIF